MYIIHIVLYCQCVIIMCIILLRIGQRWVHWWLTATAMSALMVAGNSNECVDGWWQWQWVRQWLTENSMRVSIVDGNSNECIDGWRRRQRVVRWWLTAMAMRALMADGDSDECVRSQRRWLSWIRTAWALGGSVSLRFAPFDSNCFEVSLRFAAFDSNCFEGCRCFK
jgi:hypothetical protein